MSRRFVVILIVGLALFAGLFITSRNNNNESKISASPSNHIVSQGSTGVTFIEYGDLQCPACASYFPILQQVRDKYKGKITFQFRHFPLVALHPNALSAHRAAEAAGNQGKFWEMHDMMYQNQASWASSQNVASVFGGYAQTLGLNLDKFRQDVASSQTKAIIDADIAEGQKIGATATPTFVLNGQKIESNLRTVEDFSRLIDDAITAQKD